MIRLFQGSDRERVNAITAEVFGPAAVDFHLERRFGVIRGRDWCWRKLRHIDDDIRTNAGGIFVYEDGDEPYHRAVLGYITVMLDREAGIGRIPNLAVAAGAQGRGVGRALVEHALEYLTSEGMILARVETLHGNAVGQYLYPALGFEEVVQQIYYVTRLRKESSLSRRLYVVDREQVQLYERLQRDLASAAGIEVIRDRRTGERRTGRSPTAPERRVADRRVHDVRRELQGYGRAIVELDR